ncbi:MAG: hypothetical protein SWX82_20570 [Cyanobacteriota bacterium]|nr:hypothetical protein [Cyanobacteriota bacterium]
MKKAKNLSLLGMEVWRYGGMEEKSIFVNMRCTQLVRQLVLIILMFISPLLPYSGRMPFAPTQENVANIYYAWYKLY